MKNNTELLSDYLKIQFCCENCGEIEMLIDAKRDKWFVVGSNNGNSKDLLNIIT